MARIFVGTLAVLFAGLGASRAARAEPPRLDREPVGRVADARLAVTSRGYGAGPRPTLHPFDRKPVKFAISVYGWFTDVEGESFTDGRGTSFEIPFEEIAEYVNGGFMGYAEIRWKRWSLALDSYVARLQGDAPTGLALLDAKWQVDNLLLDLRLGYTVWQRGLGFSRWRGGLARRMLRIDAIVGARYWKQSIGVELSSPLLPGRSLSRDATEEWWDPYLGVRLRGDLWKRWSVALYGDVGGFGIGDASQLTWQAQASIGYAITRQFSVFLGYRVLDLDRTTGTGPTKNGSTTTMQGPLFGAGFLF